MARIDTPKYKKSTLEGSDDIYQASVSDTDPDSKWENGKAHQIDCETI